MYSQAVNNFMNDLYPLLFGFIASILGFAAPTMISMTAVRITMEQNRREGFMFSVGAATVVSIQVLVALYFADYLMSHPEVINLIKKTAVFILVGLAIFFWFEARKKFKARGKRKKGNSFGVGFGMSILNQLAIPFYLAMSAVAKSNGWVDSSIEKSVMFMFGAAIGAFFLFSLYVVFANYISEKNQFVATNINMILSVFFLVLALITAVQLIAT